MESFEDRIIRHEGLRVFVYDDGDGQIITKGKTVIGNPTIGIGTLLSPPGGLTVDECRYLFNNRLSGVIKSLRTKLPWLDSCPQLVKEVLWEMAYQLGVDGLMGFTLTITCIKFGRYQDAADRMLKSLWAKQTPARAKELADLMRSVPKEMR